VLAWATSFPRSRSMKLLNSGVSTRLASSSAARRTSGSRCARPSAQVAGVRNCSKASLRGSSGRIRVLRDPDTGALQVLPNREGRHEVVRGGPHLQETEDK